MRKGEKGILIIIGVVAVAAMAYQSIELAINDKKDPGIPFYSSAPKELQVEATILIRKYDCRDCHVIWAQRNIMQAVPAPSLDGIGSIRSEQWLFDYFSSTDPQQIIPSRLKKEYRMPSYANIPEKDRRTLAQYMGSLQVKDWYLKQTKASEYEKLTGKKYQSEE
jgi:sulfur-oxidizing protein SoxX